MKNRNKVHLRRISFLCFLCLSYVLVQCKGKEQAKDVSTADFLPKVLGEGTSRAGEVRVFVGESLWEYINGDAELYHQYDFVEVATADYTRNELEFVADVYRFDNGVNAYGLYTAIRPDQPENFKAGVIGFVTETTISLVKGDFVVQLIAFDNSEATKETLQEMATAIVSVIPGTSAVPQQFALFPAENKFAASDRFYAASFQGRSFLTEFFSQDYVIKGDTIRLFLSHISAQNKLDLWIEAITQEIDTNIDLSGLSYDSDRTVAIQTFSGMLIAGVKGDYLVGMINYSDDKQPFLEDWLAELSK